MKANAGSFGGNSFGGSDNENPSSEGNVYIGGGQIIITTHLLYQKMNMKNLNLLAKAVKAFGVLQLSLMKITQ